MKKKTINHNQIGEHIVLSSQLNQFEKNMQQKIDQVNHIVNQTAQKMQKRMDQMLINVERKMRETRTYFDVVAENMEDTVIGINKDEIHQLKVNYHRVDQKIKNVRQEFITYKKQH